MPPIREFYAWRKQEQIRTTRQIRILRSGVGRIHERTSTGLVDITDQCMKNRETWLAYINDLPKKIPWLQKNA